MKKRMLIMTSLGLIATGGMTIGVGRISSQTQSSGTLTPQEIESKHAQIFLFGRRPIQETLSQTTGDVYLHGSFLSTQYQDTYSEKPNPSNIARLEMESLTCSCSLVVLGKIGTGTSHVTADNGFLYTDWGFFVEDVIRNNPDSSVAAGSSITVVKGGGRMQIQGRAVYAIDDLFSDFQTGDEYLLFLHFIPKTGAYAAYRSVGYVFHGGKATQLSLDGGTKPHTAALDLMDKNTLLKTARAAAATIWPGCKGVIQ
jgi:hypothetical protein